MSDLDALLSAVLADPADDLSRLVYADALDDRGDADRAALIRVQCGLGRAVRPADSLTAREGELLAGRWREWAAPAAPAACLNLGPADGPMDVAVRFGRGFVAEVVAPFGAWVERADALRAAHPVEQVTLTTLPMVFRPDAGWLVLLDDPRQALFPVLSAEQAGARAGLHEPPRRRTALGLPALRWPGVAFTLPPPGGVL